MKNKKAKKIGWSAMIIATICILLFPSGIAIDPEYVSEHTMVIGENNLPDCVVFELFDGIEGTTGLGEKFTALTFRGYRYLDDSHRLQLYASEFIEWFWTPTDGRIHYCNATIFVEVWATNNSNGEELYGYLYGESYTYWWDPGEFYILGFGTVVRLKDTVNYTMNKMHWYIERQVDDYPLHIYDRTFNKYIINSNVEAQMSAIPRAVSNIE